MIKMINLKNNQSLSHKNFKIKHKIKTLLTLTNQINVKTIPTTIQRIKSMKVQMNNQFTNLKMIYNFQMIKIKKIINFQKNLIMKILLKNLIIYILVVWNGF